MGFLINRDRSCWRDGAFIKSFIVGVLFLAIGIAITFFAIVYATESSSQPVTDIILSNTRVFDIGGLFIYGPIVFWVLIGLYLFVWEPKKIPLTLKSIALFLVIRSFFLILTHIGPFPARVQLDASGFFSVLTSGNDLFFSSHTGMPFLMALILWDKKYWRLFCIVGSVFGGTVVLLAHLHYSIDVFAAFFITYSIHHISQEIFKRDLLASMGGVVARDNSL